MTALICETMSSPVNSPSCTTDHASRRRVVRLLRRASFDKVIVALVLHLFIVWMMSLYPRRHFHNSNKLALMDASSFHSSYKDLIYTQNATNLLPNDTEYARRESKLSLRFDWKNLTPTLDLTKHILQHQSNCSLPMATFAYRNRFGLGSDLHMYAQGICNALESNRRIRTVGDWAWMDQGHCQNHVMGSPMHCYFSQAELNCPGDASFAISNPQFDLYIENSTELLSKPNGNVPNHCPSFIGPNGKFNEHLMQIATVESLFIHVTPLLYQEATRQLNLVFGDLSRIPDDLVTVHIRWGDKVETYDGKRKRRPEMNKVDIHDYIVAVRQIIRQRRGNNQTAETANVFLATEDPAAVKAFRAAMPPGWKLYVDQFLTETQSHRVNEYNGASKMSKRLGGSAGLVALGSLLVAMEANDFVLTTESNWSRVMDSLRQAIVESRVNRRTNMVDLRKWKGVAKTEHTIM